MCIFPLRTFAQCLTFFFCWWLKIKKCWEKAKEITRRGERRIEANDFEFYAATAAIFKKQQRRIPTSSDFNFFPFHLAVTPDREEFYCAIELLLQIFNFIFFTACTQHTFYSAASWPSFRVWERLMRDPKKRLRKGEKRKNPIGIKNK